MQNERRLAGLDGVRALAVAGVLVYHVHPAWLPGGFLGVDMFFALSGYLITSLLVTEFHGTARVRLGAFWRRRARRLLPELLVVLSACVAVGRLAGGADLDESLRGDVLSTLGFVNNWWQIHRQADYFAALGPPPLLQHMWSLGVEEQFYLVWPPLLAVLLAVFRGRTLRIAAVAGVGALATTAWMAFGYLHGTGVSRLYFGTDTHCCGLLLGACAGLWLPPHRLRVLAAPGQRHWRLVAWLVGPLGVLGIGLAMVHCSSQGPLLYLGGFTAVGAATVLVCLAAAAPTRFGAVLGCGPLRWLGRRSYGVYLWHWPLIVCVSRVAWPAADRTWVTVAEFTAPVALAALTHRRVHLPIAARGWRATLRRTRMALERLAQRRPWAAGAVAAGSCFCVSLLVLGVVAVNDQDGLAAQLRAAELQQQLEPQQQLDAQQQAPASAAPTPVGARPASPLPARPASSAVQGRDVTTIGDSVMLAAAPELRAALPGVDVHATVGRQMAAAPELLRELLRQGALRRVVVIGLGTNGPFPPSLLDTVLGLLGPQRSLYLVDVHVPGDWQNPVNQRLRDFARAHRGVTVVDWDGACAPHASWLWPDDTHPRPGDGTRLYADTLVGALRQG